MAAPVAVATNDQRGGSTMTSSQTQTAARTPERTAALNVSVASVIEGLSGEPLGSNDYATNFLELGFDSLFLAQVATQIQRTFNVKVTFRQLLNDLPSVEEISAHILATNPPKIDATPDPAPAAARSAEMAALPDAGVAAVTVSTRPANGAQLPQALEGLFREQLAAMQALVSQQNQILLGQGVGSAEASIPQHHETLPPPPPKQAAVATVAPSDEPPSRFQIYRPGNAKKAADLTPSQREFVDDLVSRYTARTLRSKEMTARYRSVLADPRTAAGFRLEWKELVYPIVSKRSKGSKIWDLDGNEYVDLVNGYGQTALGHAPDFVVDAITEQMRDGFPIGPQSPIAGEVAELFAQMTGNERVTFCNTGSEAVMAAMRVARTVTGRDKVVVFNGDYHGQFDEVLVKGRVRNSDPGALPVAPGIPTGSVGNMVVLPYNDPETLSWIRDHAEELAAVVVEPVQSRHPAVQPKEFLQELRTITQAAETALIFDEVVTGFRVHQGGMQAVFGIQADMATYGKVMGGGMPIGVLAGKSHFMDALDGGQWQFGDDSVPEVAPTFFAGTFVRHPLVLAAARAVLLHLKEAGPALQERLTARTASLVERLNAALASRGIKTRLETFGSWFYVNFSTEDRLASLFFHHMRLLGVHIQEGFPCFLTTEHTDGDCDLIYDAFIATLDALQAVQILPPITQAIAESGVHHQRDIEAELPDEIPLTEAQTEIWLSAQLGDNASCAFNESASVHLDGALDSGILQQALNDLMARHDALRATLGSAGTVLHVAASMDLAVTHVDLSASATPEAELAQLVDQDLRTAFDMAGPLIRVQLVRLGSMQHVLVITAHHIICDGWSFNLLVTELGEFYAARRDGKQVSLLPAMSFRRYALMEAARKAESQAAETFWLERLSGAPEELNLPTDRARPVEKSFNGATFRTTIDRELYRDVKKVGARQGCTLFATLLASVQVLIGRLSGQNDVVVAVPTAAQSQIQDQALVGHCVNFLPMRAPFNPKAPFSEHLATIKRHVLDSYDHQDTTFGTLVRKLGLRRDRSLLPLTNIQFNLERLAPKIELRDLSLRLAANGKAFTNFDIFFNMIESDDGIEIQCDYNTDLFDEATIDRWTGHLETLLRSIVADVSKPICRLSLLSVEEKTWLLDELNQPEREGLTGRKLHEIIADRAAATPDAIAAACKETALSYRELDQAANRLAHRLRALVPGVGHRIALATERTLDMLVALVAIHKAGHAYVPLDPQYPNARLKLVLNSADVSALICDGPEVATLVSSTTPVLRLDAERSQIEELPDYAPSLPESAGGTDATAYVIFTSGSTGAPKGVEITHGSLVNLLGSMAHTPGFTAQDSMIAVTTISFDIAALELFLPLLAGGRTIIADRDTVRSGFGLVSLIEESKASVLQATPALWRLLIEAGFKSHPGLKMLCGGEPLPRDLADELLKGGGELWNVYGPTETTIWSSAGLVKPGTGPITIGSPVSNTQLHILDADDELAPVGVLGHLHIGGMGLAKGYFRRQDLTEKAFKTIALEDRPPARLYRTGDIGRRLADGTIQLLGRDDQQVKLRGFRIELGDIEAVIRSFPDVTASAAAVLDEGAGPRLVGYYVQSHGVDIPLPALTAHAAAQLPDYMVPALWVRLDTLPLTPNGKLDRKALPKPELSAPVDRPITLPRTDSEKKIAQIWSNILQVDRIGVDENIFSLGADSMHIFRITARMNDQGIGLEAKHLIQNPTVEKLAALADELLAGRATIPNRPSLRSFRREARQNQGTVH